MLTKSFRTKNILFLLYIDSSERFFEKMVWFFNIYFSTNYDSYIISICMAARFDPHRYFAYPQSPRQRQYELLRSFYVNKVTTRTVADQFGYTLASFNALRRKFKARKSSFKLKDKPGPWSSLIPKEIQEPIFEIRRVHNLSAYRIDEMLTNEGNKIKPRTINRVARESGFSSSAPKSQIGCWRSRHWRQSPEGFPHA